MDLATWRDLVIVIWGFIGVLAIIFLCIIVLLFYRKTSSLIKSADTVVGKVNGVVDYVDKEVIRPVTQFSSLIEGIIKGINMIKEMFRKKEDVDE
ncbi:MAG: hypothetical protein JXA01_03195 [Dehalococcoidia bacterium]|nr:hypothetical protein [Dehalococcoidia bacterium]